MWRWRWGINYLEKAVIDHVDKEDVLKQGTPTAGEKQLMTFINESGLYSLIMGSKLEGARRFKHWVTAEVLASAMLSERISHAEVEA